MRPILWIALMSICLTGCSEMRVMGNAALRELHAEYVPVDRNREAVVPVASKSVRFATAKVRTFSSFRSVKMADKVEIKGLWEHHGS